MTKQFEIKITGPIDWLVLPILDHGGVVTIKGRSGLGKSTALEAVKSLASKPTVSRKDGAYKGVVSGPGVKLTIAKSTRLTGELECTSLEGKLDLSDIIDPGIKDPEKADRRRIKALVSVTGAELEQSKLEQLAASPEEWDELTDGVDLTGDSLERAAIVKRCFEAAARGHEGLAEQAEARAASYLEDLQEEPEEPVDPETLQQSLEQAIREQSRLAAEQEAAERAAGRAAIARQKLDALHVPDDTEAKSLLEARQDALRAADMVSREAREDCEAKHKAYVAAKAAFEASEEHEAVVQHKRNAAVNALADAERLVESLSRHTETQKQLREQIEAAEGVSGPSDEDLAASEVAVKEARQRIERNAQLIALRERASKAKSHQQRAETEREEAERLRKAAVACEDLLSELVGGVGCPLRVSGGRLVLPTDRGMELLADLSDGERADVAIEAAVPHVGKDGIAVISQRIWQDLEPQAKAKVNAKCRELGITVFTAEVTADDGLTVEVME